MSCANNEWGTHQYTIVNYIDVLPPPDISSCLLLTLGLWPARLLIYILVQDPSVDAKCCFGCPSSVMSS